MKLITEPLKLIDDAEIKISQTNSTTDILQRKKYITDFGDNMIKYANKGKKMLDQIIRCNELAEKDILTGDIIYSNLFGNLDGQQTQKDDVPFSAKLFQILEKFEPYGKFSDC